LGTSNKDVIGKVSGTRKLLKNPDFEGWTAMHALKSDDQLWIYFSPDNLEAALVSLRTGEVLYIMDRATGMKSYESPHLNKEFKARGFRPPPIT